MRDNQYAGGNTALTTNECEAIQYLHADGWSRGELSMVFELDDTALARHLCRECGHEPLDEPQTARIPSGGEIKHRRTQNGLTQRELATKIGVAKSTVATWEQETRQPSRAAAQELARVLDYRDRDDE